MSQLHLLILHSFSTFFMAGLIWLVQLVHYPGFKFVNGGEFINFENFHTSRISFIVIPAMFFELITGTILVLSHQKNTLFLTAMGLLLLIWLSTFFLSVPLHSKLSLGKNLESIDALVKTNWPRTILWTLRCGILSYIILDKIKFLEMK